MRTIKSTTTLIRDMIQTIFNIITFGVIPTCLLMLQKNWLWWLAYVFVLFLFYAIKHAFIIVVSSLNIIMAKVVYSRLSEDEQIEVDIIAEHILSVYMHDPAALFENEFQQLAYTALAMRDLDIKPAFFFDMWFEIKNPSKLPPASWIDAVAGMASDKLKAESNCSQTKGDPL